MQKYQHIWKHVCGYFQQQPVGRFVVRMSLSAAAALVLFVAIVSSGAQSVQAHVLSTCSTHDRSYSVVAGDTLSGIANRYGTTWSSLASHNDIADPNLIFVNQVVCIPTAGAKGSAVPVAQAQRVSAPVTSAAPAAVNTPAAISAPVAVSAPTTGSSVTSIIDQVFGPYASAATQVATCESGLNPGATNPYSSAAGLFQIMPGTWSGTSQAGSSPYNAWANTVAAHEIFVRDGYSWSEWTCK